MTITVDFNGGGFDGRVKLDAPRRNAEQRPFEDKIPESAAYMAFIAGSIAGVGARFWSVSPEYRNTVKTLGPAEAKARGLAKRHLYVIEEFNVDQETTDIVCRFVTTSD